MTDPAVFSKAWHEANVDRLLGKLDDLAGALRRT
jgi:hypothetical protein